MRRHTGEFRARTRFIAAAIGTAAALAATAAAAEVTPPDLTAPPGFCVAPIELEGALRESGAMAEMDPGALASVTYVDCLELDAWRGGDASAIQIVGRATLREAERRPVEEDAPAVAMASLDAIETADSGSDAPSPVAVMVEDGVRYATEIVPPEGRLPLRLRMSSRTGRGGFELERELVMAYAGEDGLRYMTAAVRAAGIADRIALAVYR